MKTNHRRRRPVERGPPHEVDCSGAEEETRGSMRGGGLSMPWSVYNTRQRVRSTRKRVQATFHREEV
jgi:hypothetical protein